MSASVAQSRPLRASIGAVLNTHKKLETVLVEATPRLSEVNAMQEIARQPLTRGDIRIT